MAEQLNSLQMAESGAHVRAQIKTATTFAPEAYTSEEVLAVELERVFARNWMALCFGQHIPKIGDVFPIELSGIPLVAVRGNDGVARVFHNICAYDACPIVLHKREGLRELTSPYHGWRFNLQGELIGIPYWNGEEEPDISVLNGHDGNMKAIRTEEQLGVVLINMDGLAPAVDLWTNPLRNELGHHYALDRMVAVGPDLFEARHIDRTVAANWKTYLENACINILHESFTHRAYRASPEVPRIKNGEPTFVNIVSDGLHAFKFKLADFARTYKASHLPHLGLETNQPPETGYFWTHYPNLCGSAFPSSISMNICLPVEPGVSRLFHAYFVAPEALEVEDFAEGLAVRTESLQIARVEDQLIIEAVQRARRSPAFESFFYTPYWDTLHHGFNKTIQLDLERSSRSI